MTTDISVQRTGWDPTLQQEIVDEYEYDGGNSSSRLFERSRIKALAGKFVKNLIFKPFLFKKTSKIVFIFFILENSKFFNIQFEPAPRKYRRIIYADIRANVSSSARCNVCARGEPTPRYATRIYAPSSAVASTMLYAYLYIFPLRRHRRRHVSLASTYIYSESAIGDDRASRRCLV